MRLGRSRKAATGRVLYTSIRKRLRAAARHYESEELERIIALSELDQTMFWKVVKSKKKDRNKKVCEIKFNDVKVTSTDDILRGWCEYFSDLYSVSENKDFDSEHRRTIEAMTNP